MDKIARMRELGELLRNASRAYYQQDQEIMSNLEYDKLYDEAIVRENFIGNEIRNAGKCCQNGQIGYRTGTQHNQKNKIRRTCIHPFCQYHQSRDRGHEQADDNDYRQQNHITVDLTEIHCAISVVSVRHCSPIPASAE